MKKLLSILILASLATGVFALPNLLSKEDYGANSINNLDIRLSSEDIIIKETNDSSSIEVEVYCNYKKYAPEVSVSGSTLYIEASNKKRNLFASPTGFSCKVILYVPQKKDFDEISISLSSGEVEIQRILSAKSEIRITASSGDISSERGLFADNVIVKASSGDIELYNIDADQLEVSTSSGDIDIRKFTGESSSVHSTSGSIKINDFAAEYTDFKSSSGSISVIKLDCDYFDAENTSGGISLELENAPTATSKIECSSGDIELYMPMRAKFSVEASCSSGTFRDKFNNNRMNPRSNYRMDYNGGGSVIKLQTTSGDISLEY